MFFCAALWLSSFAASAEPVLLHYELVPLSDPARFEYRYEIENGGLAAGVNWFSVDFDPTLYDALAISGSATDWDAQILQPAFGLPAQLDVFTAMSAIGIGGSAASFDIQFTWLGNGLPGAQHFQVWDPDTFDIRYEGVTVATGVQALPEPPAWALSLLGLAAAAAAGRRNKTYTGNRLA